MKYLKYSLLLLLAFIPSISMAQKVYQQNGFPVIDLTELKSITTTENNRITGTPSESAFLNGTTNEDTTTPSFSGKDQACGEWNKKLSRKFQIMKVDLENTTYNWVNAYNKGQAYSGEGGSAGQWRLPTKHELEIIFSLHPQLLKLGSNIFTPFSNGEYWTCSEFNTNTACLVSFNNGYSFCNNKCYGYRVRLVRDLN